jgi:hypothetical protein
MRSVDRLLREVGPDDRLRLLHGPDLRGFLSEAEIWSDAYLAAADARGPASRGRKRPVERLFDRISRTEHLVDLLPGGRIDPGFPSRAARLAGRRLEDALDDLAALLLGARLAFLGGRGRFEARLTPRESAEQGRPAGRVDLGTFCGPAGSLTLSGTPAGSRSGPAPLVARLQDGLLALGLTGGRVAFLPQAASPARHPCSMNGAARPGAAVRDGAAGIRLVRRRLIPGTPILLAPALRSGPRVLRVGRDLPGLEDRLASALRLVHLVWPAAHEEILRRTAIVVPVREPGLVSYSLAARPGISFINVHSKSTVQLADDVLHETAHHLLHDLEEVAPLLVSGPDTEEVQAFDSPWRGTRRPLHGILHGAYTFLYRAELYARLRHGLARHPRVVGPLLGPARPGALRRESRRELDMIGRALRDLDAAARSRLVAPAGRAQIRSLRAWRSRLLRSRA